MRSRPPEQVALADLPDWQKEEAGIAKAIIEDSGEQFVDAPDEFDFHEYRQICHSDQ